MDCKRELLRKGSEVTSIYFILSGYISIYDDYMNLVNEYEQYEIFGIQPFKEYCFTHLDINLSELDSPELDNMIKETFESKLKKGEVERKAVLLASGRLKYIDEE